MFVFFSPSFYTDSFIEFVSIFLIISCDYSSLWTFFFFLKFVKIKAIKIYENIDILENYSNYKNENNVA